MARASLSTKLLVSAVTALVSAGLAWLAYQRLRPEVESVKIVDTSEELVRMMNERLEPGGGEPEPAPEPGDAYPPPLVREPLDEETARRFYPANESELWDYDPYTYSVRAGHLKQTRKFEEHPDGGWTIVTNALGMREDQEVLSVHPDLRIIVTGDSHTDGVCATSESFTNVLEGFLAEDLPGKTVEALNAGMGGHNLYNYVGTFERLAYLRPDIYVVVVYGGNDFSSSMLMHRYFNRRKPFKTKPYHYDPGGKLEPSLRSIGSQEMVQEVYFLNNPDDFQPAVDLACSVSVELERMCTEAGAELLLVYLPPPSRGQPEQFRGELAQVLPAVGLDHVELGVSDRIADAWLAFLEERGLEYVDLREKLRAAKDLMYWRTDHHLNVAGHRLVAGALHDAVRSLVDL